MIARTTIGLLILAWTLPAVAEPRLRDISAELVGSQIHFMGRLHDDGTVATVKVRYRAADLGMQSVEMARDRDRLLAVVDADPLLLGGDSVRLLYSIVARNAAGDVVTHLGSDDDPVTVIVTRVFAASDLDKPDNPLTTTPPAAAERAWHESWWLWTAVSVVVLAGGVSAGMVLISD